jgi:hypothetical protein
VLEQTQQSVPYLDIELYQKVNFVYLYLIYKWFFYNKYELIEKVRVVYKMWLNQWIIYKHWKLKYWICSVPSFSSERKITFFWLDQLAFNRKIILCSISLVLDKPLLLSVTSFLLYVHINCGDSLGNVWIVVPFQVSMINNALPTGFPKPLSKVR